MVHFPISKETLEKINSLILKDAQNHDKNISEIKADGFDISYESGIGKKRCKIVVDPVTKEVKCQS